MSNTRASIHHIDKGQVLYANVSINGEECPENVDVFWLRESSTTSYLVHRGQRIKELTGYNDWPNGEMLSLKNAVYDPHGGLFDKIKTYRLGGNTPLFILCETIIEDEPVINIGKVEQYSSCRHSYAEPRNFGNRYRYYQKGLDYYDMELLETVEVSKKTHVHSLMSREQIDKAVQAFADEWWFDDVLEKDGE